MERRVVIHGSNMGGYGTPGLLVVVAIVAVVTAALSPIRTNRTSLGVWLFLIVAFLAAIVWMELTSRRNVVEVAGGRVRWSFRQPPEKGDEPLTNLQKVNLFPSSGAQLVFPHKVAMVSRSDFTRGAVSRLVDALREGGTQVNEMTRG